MRRINASISANRCFKTKNFKTPTMRSVLVFNSETNKLTFELNKGPITNLTVMMSAQLNVVWVGFAVIW